MTLVNSYFENNRTKLQRVKSIDYFCVLWRKLDNYIEFHNMHIKKFTNSLQLSHKKLLTDEAPCFKFERNLIFARLANCIFNGSIYQKI